MPCSKEDLLKSKKRLKKAIKYLNKLQKICWSTVIVATWELIEETEKNLLEVERKLKNREYTV